MLLMRHVHVERAVNRERIFRDRSNPLELSDQEITSKYRLDRQSILDLCDLLKEDLERPTRRSKSLSVSTQVFCALRYFAVGSFQQVVGDLHGVSKPSVSRAVHLVAAPLCRHVAEYIKFPQHQNEKRSTKEGFYNLARFPNTLGAIDGALIPIIAPQEDEHLYVCRKG